MNRHQSNPFLSSWDDETDATLPITRPYDVNSTVRGIDQTSADNNNERSSTFTRRSSSSQAEFGSNRPGGLYWRNMSSFEAASLQLEQQQQLQKNGTLPDTQKDLIARMTADFQSAIEINDKQFALDAENLGIEGFNPFDPFETIVDDDVSLPSPALSNQADKMKSDNTGPKSDSSQKSSMDADINRPDQMELGGKQIRKNAHDSIDDDEDELVSTPVRNIKSSQIVGDSQKLTQESSFERPSSFANDLDSDRQLQTDNRDTNSITKASLFASLLASAEAGSQQAVEDIPGLNSVNPDDANDVDGNEIPTSYINNVEHITHVIKGSPNSTGDGNMDRPVSFFDPFETVIDKDALTSLMNETQSQQELKTYQNQEATITNADESCIQSTQERDLNTLPPQSGEESISIETVIENDPTQTIETARSNDPNQPTDTTSTRVSQHDASIAMSRPSGRQIQPLPSTITPSKRSNRQKQKVSSQDDSSDSSDEDDRIQIVIKARDSSKVENKGQPAIVPLLPPPPSKNSMKQARERGQVDDMPSPIMSYRTRNEPKGSAKLSSDESDEEAKVRDVGKKDMSKEDKDQVELEEDDVSNNDDGKFVIPMKHSDDEDGNYGKPDTPLYDDDTSYVLEEFPAKYEGPGWDMMLRHPPKKKLTSNRFWKKIFVKLAQVPLAPEGRSSKQQQHENDGQTCMALQIFDKPEDKKPLQEIPIQATYTVSEISSQLFDQFGKIFTIKLQYIFYKERVGVRQGQLARFIHTGHIGSSTTSGGHGVDPISVGTIKRMGAPIEHSPQISQIIKLGCNNYEDIKQFKECLEECLFRMSIHRDRALSTYKTEEVQMAVRDETYIELNQIGTIMKQLARVRLFFLSFLNGTPTVEVGINDIHRQGREVVGRMDILPVVTEEWIRLEACELHSTVDKDEFENPDSRIIKLVPPDATFFELMRFRVRPPRNRELPLQISANMSVTRTKVSINCEVMVPGCVSRKHGQIPCENIAIRIHIPECWIYFFREEKHFRMGSKKSVNRRPGKVKGIERFLGGGGLQDFNDESSLIEVTSGQAKYEHHHHAIVWRAARWPKESQSAYVQNTMKIRLPLTAYDKMPENFYEYVHVEYTMPATTVSHTTLRSISVNPYDDEPPEKYVKYSAKYEYKVKMRLSVNLGTRPGASEPEASPIIIMKQPDLHDDLQREDSDDDQSNDDGESD